MADVVALEGGASAALEEVLVGPLLDPLVKGCGIPLVLVGFVDEADASLVSPGVPYEDVVVRAAARIHNDERLGHCGERHHIGLVFAVLMELPDASDGFAKNMYSSCRNSHSSLLGQIHGNVNASVRKYKNTNSNNCQI